MSSCVTLSCLDGGDVESSTQMGYIGALENVVTTIFRLIGWRSDVRVLLHRSLWERLWGGWRSSHYVLPNLAVGHLSGTVGSVIGDLAASRIRVTSPRQRPSTMSSGSVSIFCPVTTPPPL